MNTSKHSYAAFAKRGETGYIATSPNVHEAVTIVLADSRASQCTVAAYEVHAAFIDPEIMDPLFQFEFEKSADDNESRMEAQLQAARDAYELNELRRFKLEILRSQAPDDDTLEEIARLESALTQAGS